MRLLMKELHLKNYRSCQDATFRPHRALSVLIGANGAGKTTILNGIQLLTRPKVHGRRHVESKGPVCTLSTRLVSGRGADVLGLRARLLTTTDESNADRVTLTSLDYDLRDSKQRTTIVNIPQSLLFLVRENPEQAARYLRHLGQLDGDKASQAALQIHRSRQWFESISYFQASRFTDPSQCPIYFETEGGTLSSRYPTRQSMHVSFLFNLYRLHRENNEQYGEYLAFVGMHGMRLVDAITFKPIKAPTNQYEVRIGGKLEQKKIDRSLVIPTFRIGRSSLSANQLSEGTFRALAISFYLLTSKDQMMLIEEPELCVHHGLLNSLVELIKSASAKKQVIISTHSDNVLDLVEPDNVFVVTNERGHGTTVNGVPESLSAREFDGLRRYLLETGSLGEYWRHGGLG